MENAFENKTYLDCSAKLEERVEDLLSRLTMEEKISLLSETSEPIERVGMGRLYHGNEALHGVVRPGNFTVFPQAIGLAAAWNPDLLYEIASAISDEARARHHAINGGAAKNEAYNGRFCGLLTFWSPDLNLARDPRWGRTGETYGEDPYLASRMGVAFVRGMQGDDPRYLKTVTTPKHFTANNEEHNRISCNAVISEGALRDYYLVPFEAAVTEAGCAAVMGAYNAVNGIPCHANKWLLTDVLRSEWGFDGYMVTDCGAVSHLYHMHKYAKTLEDAAALAINAGVDLECGTCGTTEQVFQKYLMQAMEAGLVKAETIDRAAGNVLKARFRLGLFDPEEHVPWSGLPHETVGCSRHKELALNAARESIVLLKNSTVDGKKLLPLKKQGSIAVIGKNAAMCQFGDYSGKPANPPVTPLQGLIDHAGQNVKIMHVPWKYRKKASDFTTIPAVNLIPSVDRTSEHGLLGNYYANQNLMGVSMARVDRQIDFEWENMAPDPYIKSERFSVRWTGAILSDISGEYHIRLTSRGPSPCEPAMLYLDGNPVWDGTIVRLEAEKPCSVIVEFSKVLDSPLVRLEWIAPGFDGEESFTEEVRAAEECDIVVAVVGLGTEYEMEGHDRAILDLPSEQMAMLMKVASVNPNIIVVLLNGSALAVNWLDENIPALIEAWYPGEQGGSALAEIIFGGCNPSGRLPLTFYKSTGQLPAFDDYELTSGRTYMHMQEKPLYSFGHGLSYTEFHYGPVLLDKEKASPAETVVVSMDITNTGDMDGAETVQLYVRRAGASKNMPVKQLKSFKKVFLKAGECRRITMPLRVSELKHWDCPSKTFKVDSGSCEIMLGASSSDIRSIKSFEVI